MKIKDLVKQITQITSKLSEMGLSDREFYPAEKNGFVYVSGQKELSIALKNLPYKKIYDELHSTNNYNIRMFDGALIQIMYTFTSRNELIKHRLAFFPSYKILEYQNDPEIYESDDIYSKLLRRNIIPTPIRFDYDPNGYKDVIHPSSHMTLGQYQNCRIPVSSPLTPLVFIKFILTSFYDSDLDNFSSRINIKNGKKFNNCISIEERKIFHINI